MMAPAARDVRVNDIMTREVITVSPDDRVEKAARLMNTHEISGLPVVEENRVTGMITESDFVERYQTLELPTFVEILGGIFPMGSLGEVEQSLRRMAAVRVRDLMSTPVVAAGPDWTIEQVANAMIRRKINRLPVLDNDEKLVGIVSRRDLIEATERPG